MNTRQKSRALFGSLNSIHIKMKGPTYGKAVEAGRIRSTECSGVDAYDYVDVGLVRVSKVKLDLIA